MSPMHAQLRSAGCPDDVCAPLAEKAALTPGLGLLLISLAEQLGPVVWSIVKQWLNTPPAPVPAP